MSKRTLYLVAYDIREPSRLRHILEIIKDFATGGQKSAYECYLSSRERSELLDRAGSEIDPGEDRLFLLRLPGTPRVHALGIATSPQDPGFFYQG